VALVPLLALLAFSPPLAHPTAEPAGPYPDGQALIRAMHDRYQATWYRTLTFVQTTTLRRPTERQETWYEAARIPGQLRIDLVSPDSGNTYLFRSDSLYRYRQGTLAGSRAFVHPLMVLGFDVYADPPDETIKKLSGLGIDLSRIRDDSWQGRPVYVVGAPAGDSTTTQFWIDRERLLFVRMLETAPDGSGKIAETQFNRYEPLGGGWIALEVVFNINGELVTREAYADVKADPVLPDQLFDPARYSKATWMR
jgi:hypothetical protein